MYKIPFNYTICNYLTIYWSLFFLYDLFIVLFINSLEKERKEKGQKEKKEKETPKRKISFKKYLPVPIDLLSD